MQSDLSNPLTLVQAPGDSYQEAPCPHYGQCGGCSLQHLKPSVYVARKRQGVIDALERAGIRSPLVHSLTETPSRSRRRATLAAVKRKDKVTLGFHAPKSSAVVDIPHCHILRPELIAIMPSLKHLLTQLLKNGQTVDVSLTVVPAGLDIVILGDVEMGLSQREAMAKFSQDSAITRVSYGVHSRSMEPVIQKQRLSYVCGETVLSLPPAPFLQASEEGEQFLVRQVCNALEGSRCVVDLFAGCGTFTFPTATKDRRVHSVEGDKNAFESLAGGAKSNNRVTAERRDLDKNPLTVVELRPFDAVIFNPPRKGALAQAKILAQSSIPLIVAVSCNPSTFARDAAHLLGGGYGLDGVFPLDQFVWSPHVEIFAVFRKRSSKLT